MSDTRAMLWICAVGVEPSPVHEAINMSSKTVPDPFTKYVVCCRCRARTRLIDMPPELDFRCCPRCYFTGYLPDKRSLVMDLIREQRRKANRKPWERFRDHIVRALGVPKRYLGRRG